MWRHPLLFGQQFHGHQGWIISCTSPKNDWICRWILRIQNLLLARLQHDYDRGTFVIPHVPIFRLTWSENGLHHRMSGCHREWLGVLGSSSIRSTGLEHCQKSLHPTQRFETFGIHQWSWTTKRSGRRSSKFFTHKLTHLCQCQKMYPF